MTVEDLYRPELVEELNKSVQNDQTITTQRSTFKTGGVTEKNI